MIRQDGIIFYIEILAVHEEAKGHSVRSWIADVYQIHPDFSPLQWVISERVSCSSPSPWQIARGPCVRSIR